MKARLCSECERPISKARLQALPETTTCKECSKVVAKTAEDLDLDRVDSRELVGSISE